jgi:hypothetical protein
MNRLMYAVRPVAPRRLDGSGKRGVASVYGKAAVSSIVPRRVGRSS